MRENDISGTTAADIAASVRDAIEEGRLAVGASLPTIRALAEELGVNRNTVAAAYASLVATGLVDARGRGGTIVRARHAVAGEGMTSARDQVNLASGNPDRSLLPPVDTSLPDYAPPLYGETGVDVSLEQWARGSDAPDGASLVVTAGAVDAVERLLTAYLVRGDAVALEDPCFLSSADVLSANGYTAIPMAMDAEGVLPRALAAALTAGARAVVLTPRAHNPTGASITSRRARDLRDVLSDHPHVLVIEDDHFSEVAASSYARATPPTATRWALVRSVSKFLGPDLRLAVVVCDAGTAERLDARLGGTVWVSTILQRIAGRLLSAKATTATFARARDAYAERSAALVEELADRGIPCVPPADGLNVWIPLSRPEGPVVDALHERGWLVRAGADFAVGTGSSSAIRITTSTLTPDQARTFAADLDDVLS